MSSLVLNKSKSHVVPRRSKAKKQEPWVPIHAAPNPFGSAMRAQLVYADSYPFSTGAAGVPGDQVFNANSLFDPDRSGTGHQPYAFDQYASLFNRYRVDRLDYEIIVIATTGTSMATVTCRNSTTSLNGVAISYVAELPGSTTKTCTPGGDEIIIRGSCDLANLTGATKNEYRADDKYSAIVTASPSELMGLHIVVWNPSGSTVSTTYLTSKLRFHCVFFDPYDFAQS